MELLGSIPCTTDVTACANSATSRRASCTELASLERGTRTTCDPGSGSIASHGSESTASSPSARTWIQGCDPDLLPSLPERPRRYPWIPRGPQLPRHPSRRWRPKPQLSGPRCRSQVGAKRSQGEARRQGESQGTPPDPIRKPRHLRRQGAALRGSSSSLQACGGCHRRPGRGGNGYRDRRDATASHVQDTQGQDVVG